MVLSEVFDKSEQLCRIVFHPPGIIYKKEDGTVTSAVFKGRRCEGLSVDRSGKRNTKEMITDIINRKSINDYTAFIFIYVWMCDFPDRKDLAPAEVIYKPNDNIYHSEIYGKYDEKPDCCRCLSDGQARYLAKNAKMILSSSIA